MGGGGGGGRWFAREKKKSYIFRVRRSFLSEGAVTRHCLFSEQIVATQTRHAL